MNSTPPPLTESINLRNIKVAIWAVENDYTLEIVNKIKRINILPILLKSPQYDDKCSNDLFFKILDDDEINTILKQLKITHNEIIYVVNNNNCPNSGLCLTEYQLNEMLQHFTLIMDEIKGNTVNAFDLDVYEKLLKENDEKNSAVYLKQHLEEDRAKVLYIKHLITSEKKSNCKKALTLCKRPDYNQIPEISCIISDCYYDGKIVKKDLSKAIQLLLDTDLSKVPKYYEILINRLFERNNNGDVHLIIEICNDNYGRNPNLLYVLATLYSKGNDVPCDIDKAIEYCLLGINHNVGKCKNLAFDLLLKRDRTDDLRTAYEISINYAKEGNPWAQLRLARMYRKGIYIEKDIHKAAELMTSAYVSGVKDIKDELIDLFIECEDMAEEYIKSTGINTDPEYVLKIAKTMNSEGKNIDEIIEMLLTIENSGTPEAINLLIDLLLKRNKDGDVKHAYELCEKHSDNLWTRGRLSRFYRDGIYVEMNTDMAIKLMSEPAHYGINWARNEYADMLIKRGKPHDLKEAYEICLLGTFEEDVWSQIKLSRLYYNGAGTQKNIDYAIIIMRTASNKGNSIAKRELKEMLKKRGLKKDLVEIKRL